MMENVDRCVDLVDLRLIRHLQDEPRASYATLARVVAVSEATAKRRIKTLIENGVITPAMIPDLYRLGYGASALLGITIDLTEMDAVADMLCDFHETAMVLGTMGKFDIVVFVATQSVEQLMRFVTERVAPIRGVRSVETLVAPRLFKLSRDWRIPIGRLLESKDATNGTAIDQDGSLKQDRVSAGAPSAANRRKAKGTVRRSVSS
jgi:DNA-binding Lrp family transcriptional regulator